MSKRTTKGRITDFFVSKPSTSATTTTTPLDDASVGEEQTEIVPDPGDSSESEHEEPIPGTSAQATETPTIGPAVKKARVNVKKFSPMWQKSFPWLSYSSVENTMSCTICQQSGRTGVWVDGTRNFRKKTIQQHAVSEGHRLSLSSVDERQMSLDKSRLQREKAILLALKSVFWVTSEEIANRKYKSRIKFLQNLGMTDAKFLNQAANAQYTSPDIFNQLLDCLSDVSIEAMKTAIKNSPFVGIGTDESTDRSQEKHIAVIIRYISVDGKVETTFLKIKQINDGKAQSLFNSIQEVFGEFKVPFSKLVGLGADGVNVMSSAQNGLNGLVQIQNPFCLYVHCVCHRLALAVSNLTSSFPALDTMTKIIGGVYNYVQYSKLEQFKAISSILELEVLKFKRVFEIRWLSLGEAIVAIIRNYEALMVLLSQDADKGDPTAIGLHRQLSTFKYVGLLHLLADILNTVNHLSRLFQHRDVSFASIRNEVRDCLVTLDGFQNQDGPYLSNFLTGLTTDGSFKGVSISTPAVRRGEQGGQREAFQRMREELLSTLQGNIENRFPRVELIDAIYLNLLNIRMMKIG